MEKHLSELLLQSCVPGREPRGVGRHSLHYWHCCSWPLDHRSASLEQCFLANKIMYGRYPTDTNCHRSTEVWEAVTEADELSLLEAVIMCVFTISIGGLVLLEKCLLAYIKFLIMPVIMESANNFGGQKKECDANIFLPFPSGIKDNKLYMQYPFLNLLSARMENPFYFCVYCFLHVKEV